MEQEYLNIIVPLIAGYALDLLFGDPRQIPHPVRLFGNSISIGEKFLNKGRGRFVKGLMLTVVLCLITFAFFFYSQKVILLYNQILYYLFCTAFVFYGLANKSLIQEGREVFDALQNKGLEAGRKRLSWIVGRDTSKRNENQIRTAVFETLSENLNDGVIAPLFYYAVGGLPAMMTYKMINTLDSMIGYKNDKYILFGKFAARLDDVANFIPARITALLMALLTFNRRSITFIFKYGNQHASPNSGYPEAALAGILNCRFGGPNIYHGVMVEKPYIGCNVREIRHEEFRKVSLINHMVTFFVIVLIAVLYLVIL